MRYSNIIFDLDGTITEPVEGITNALIYALDKFNIQVDDRNSLNRFIGPPLRESFKEFYGFDNDMSEKAVGFYRDYYSDRGIIENDIMPGMDESLSILKKEGLKLYIATSKPEIYAKKILDNLGLLQYFDMVAGSLLDGSRDKKEMVLEYLLGHICKDHMERSRCIMIGDRRFDIEGAIKCNIHHMGVTFGYGERKELEAAGAMYIVDSAEEMTRIILNTD